MKVPIFQTRSTENFHLFQFLVFAKVELTFKWGGCVRTPRTPPAYGPECAC